MAACPPSLPVEPAAEISWLVAESPEVVAEALRPVAVRGQLAAETPVGEAKPDYVAPERLFLRAAKFRAKFQAQRRFF